ncbi:prolyl oligopeptidase family serine peptidase [Filibacter tadaridae]|uniref:Esterase n=1 Tax=Filibacter tadaridae TaxID=2483811 RepID=A0A3P5X9K8_9BACL|nr:prolyl oligopeptidase family serine peptidase [Filibacter tadaridae]VDC27530.1 esterase [Filibacter tadaridae]
MIINEETWGEIPVLHIVQEEWMNHDVPVVIFLHGFMSAKEHNLHYAYNLAKNGIRVILPDAHLHGARSEKLDEVQLSLRFWEVVLTSIEDVSFLREELLKRGFLSTAKLGVGGTSMGGITALSCLTVYEWIDAASIMMGTPGPVQLAKAQMAQFERQGFTLPVTDEERRALLDTISIFDMTKHADAMNRRPIFFWHGKKDSTVPFEPTYHFYEAMKKDYVDAPDQIEFMVDETAGHAVSRTGMLRSTDWFAVHLKK